MPRISDIILGCVIYLYHSPADAEDGRPSGGTGFLVGIRSEVKPDDIYLHVVTDRHVIQNGATVLHFNTKDGLSDWVDTLDRQWYYHPDGDDLAITIVKLENHNVDLKWLTTELIMDKAIMKEHSIGHGDDVFLVGRFVYQDGKKRTYLR